MLMGWSQRGGHPEVDVGIIHSNKDQVRQHRFYMAPYALCKLCKHGLSCGYGRRRRCGFWHSLWELVLPVNCRVEQFIDKPEEVGGAAGIDAFFFLGQMVAAHVRKGGELP